MNNEEVTKKQIEIDESIKNRVLGHIEDIKSNQEAASILNDPDKLAKTLLKANKRFEKLGNGPFDKIIDEAKALWRLIIAYSNKSYREAPKSTIIASVLALLYFINPFDLLPDMLPVIGQIDDALVVSTILYAISSDLHKFISWEHFSDEMEEDEQSAE